VGDPAGGERSALDSPLGLPFLLALIRLLPQWLRDHPVEWIAALVVDGYFLARRWSGSCKRGIFGVGWLARALDRSETVFRKVLDRGFLIVFAGLTMIGLVHVGCRITFTARGAGMKIRSRCWHKHGMREEETTVSEHPRLQLSWPHLSPLDSGQTVRLGTGWPVLRSRCCDSADPWRLCTRVEPEKCFETFFCPGWTGYLIFLGYYLDVHFEIVAERDWHATLFARVLALSCSRVGEGVFAPAAFQRC